MYFLPNISFFFTDFKPGVFILFYSVIKYTLMHVDGSGCFRGKTMLTLMKPCLICFPLDLFIAGVVHRHLYPHLPQQC